MCNKALISKCSSLHSYAMMHELVLFTEAHISVQVHASMQSKWLYSIWGCSSLVTCWTQGQTMAGWHRFQSHFGQLILKNYL